MNNKTALFIGRLQPTHLGHLDAFKQAYAEGITNIIVGIGSSDKEYTESNPFTFGERHDMAKIMFGENTDVYPIPDVGDDKVWMNYILKNLPKFDYVITGNPWVAKIFKEQGIKTINLEIKTPIKASTIRKQIAMSKKGLVQKLCKPELVDYLDKINARERMKKIYQLEFIKPDIAVDGILKVDGKIVVIERKNPPHGFALPGGFIDYGESPEDAVVREMKEELSVDVKIKKQFGTYGNPDRDPRGHTISVVYELELENGELKAADDAKAFQLIDPSYIEQMHFAFDHKNILLDYLSK